MKAMKKVLALALALAMVVTAVPVTSAEAANLTAGKSKKITYYVGKTNTLKLTGVKASNIKSTTWSKNGSKAVNLKSKAKTSAKVQVVKAGKAKVTATVKLKSGKTKKYTMNITAKNPTLTVKASSTTIKVGETAKLTVTKKPSTATVKYSSSDEAVASVSKGVVTANGLGTVTITAKLTCGTTTITKKVTVKVVGEEGITAKLANPISADYPTTTLVNNPAVIQVVAVRDGEPVANEAVVLSAIRVAGTGSYKINDNGIATTNAKGVATFVLGNTNQDVKSTDADEVATYKYTVYLASEGQNTNSTNGEVSFAAYALSGVINLNDHGDAHADKDNFNELAVSTNITSGTKADGVTKSVATVTQDRTGSSYVGSFGEYVNSQQVSSVGASEHKVGFETGIPTLIIPGSSSDLNAAVEYNQTLAISDGPYHVYAGDVNIFKLDVNPNELTRAYLNFSKLQLSEYTQLRIETYSTESDAKDGNNKVYSDVLKGERDQKNFGYQLPLDEDYNGQMWVKVVLDAAGQVNTDKNAGYEITGVTGVYRTQTTTKGTQVPIKGASVTWSKVTATMSQVQSLASASAVYTKISGEILAEGKTVDHIDYQVPVFPYTGNAILTAYDKNSKVLAYYVCPTVNAADVDCDRVIDNPGKINTNILLETNLKKVYKVSQQEAFNQVGDVTQSGNRVIVNTEKVGVTSLKGTITINGVAFDGLDAANSSVYTSIQWNPIPTQTVDNSTGVIGLIGQKIEVVAQLTDKNNNPVSIAGQDVYFYAANGSALSAGSNVAAKDETGATAADAKVVSVDSKTDVNGQAKLVLSSADIKTVLGIYAKCNANGYSFAIKATDGKLADDVDVYWVDADLNFVDSTYKVGTPEAIHKVSTTKVDSIVATSGSAIILPKVGSNWEYGVYTTGTKFKKGLGVFGDMDITIDGLNVKVSKGTDSVGTVTPATDGKGYASAYSTKAGKFDIVTKIDSTSVTDDVTFTVGSASVKSSGVGNSALAKKLTINGTWVAEGTYITVVTPNNLGAVALTTGAAIDVYVRVADSYGNPVADGTQVDFKLDDGQSGKITLSSASGTTLKGIAKVTVTAASNVLTTYSSVVTATLHNDTSVDAATQSIKWFKNADAFGIDETDDLDGNNKNYVSAGKIVLTFTDEIIANTVVKEQFTVKNTTTNKIYEVASVAVDGKVVTLTLKDAPTDYPTNETWTVTIDNTTASVKGIGYKITSEQGVVNKVTSVALTSSKTGTVSVTVAP